ncbi:retrotransposon protein, putative, ty1-copia subclass [Tanacetum coccineum]
MNMKETLIMELHSLLQTVDQGIKKIDVPATSAAPMLTVGHNAKKIKTSHSNWKGKSTKGRSDHGSKRKDLKDGKVKKGIHSGMFMIELHNTTTLDSWVLDTGCGAHICTVLQGLKESKRLKHGELNLVMGNRKITLVTRIGKYELMLKSGVRIYLNNYCYSLEMTRNIISFHALFKDATPCKGIYETIECIGHNGNVILNVGSSNKLDKSKLWHSRLGHVNKKRIAQLQKDGVLESFDFKSDYVLSYDESKSMRVSERALMTLFGQDNETFTSTMSLNLDQLQRQLDKDEFQEDKSMALILGVNNLCFRSSSISSTSWIMTAK